MRFSIFIISVLFVLPLYAQKAASPTVTPTPVSLGQSIFGGPSDGPTYINADSLTLRSNERFFIYTGHVVVIQGEMTMTSKTLEGTYTAENKIERLIARGDVVITKPTLKATGQKAVYEAATEVVTLYDNPQVTQNESILNADRIKVYLREDRSEAEGTVRVTLVKKETPKATPTVAPTGTGLAAVVTPVAAATTTAEKK